MDKHDKEQLPKIKYFLDDRVSMRTKIIDGIECQVEYFDLRYVTFEKRTVDKEIRYACPYIFENDSLGIFNQYKTLDELKKGFAGTITDQVKTHVQDKGILRELVLRFKLQGEPFPSDPDRGTLAVMYGSVAYIPLSPAREEINWE